MTKKLFNKAVKEGKIVSYYLFKDLGVGTGSKFFIETGTHIGNGVQYAIDAGFENVFSCEFMKSRYNECMERFKDDDNVSLWLGTSVDCIPEMLKQVDQKACFWLDAHAEGGGVPTFEELDIIKSHPIKDHTILIDDIPVYFNDKKESLEKKIKSINKDYTIEYHKSINPDLDYILAAYIK
jgi:hypothetical protein|tara:strand:- start:2893 stop:3435 length:543 start_codon:yes stop_codon:yes gene_type:complete